MKNKVLQVSQSRVKFLDTLNSPILSAQTTMLNYTSLLLFSSMSVQEFFMVLNMDYETGTPTFTVKWSLNCLLAIEIN